MKRARICPLILLTGIISVAFVASVSAIDANEQLMDEAFEQLSNKAKAHYLEGEMSRAIPLFEEMIRMKPNDVRTLILLGNAYEVQATLLSKKGLTNEALAFLEKSKWLSAKLLLDPKSVLPGRPTSDLDRELIQMKQYTLGTDAKHTNQALANARASVFFGQAMDYFVLKQYGLARAFILDGLRYNQSNPLAYELLGDIEYYSQNLKKAREAYQASFKLESRKRVKEKLEKVMKEFSVESHLAEYMDEHFIIRFSRGQNLEGSEIREMLRQSYRAVSQDLGYYLDFKTVVVLYNEADYRKIASIPHWSGALFDGKIRLPVYDAKITRKQLHKLIQHEVTHVFVTELSNNLCPVWLHEGLAQYEENKIVPVDLRLVKLAVKTDALKRADELEKGVYQTQNEVEALLYYAQSFLLTKSLIEKYRFYKLKELFEKIAARRPFREAFKKTYRISFEDFVDKWIQAVNVEYATLL